MDDAAAGRHQVDRARLNHRMAADAVAVLDRALEQIGDRGEVDVRVRTHVHSPARREPRGPKLVDEDERADHAPWPGWKGSTNLEVAKVVSSRSNRFHRWDSFASLNHINRLEGKGRPIS
jgi:hypothetical protein